MRPLFSTAIETYHCLSLSLRTCYLILQSLRTEILDQSFDLIAVAPHRFNDL